MICLISFSKFSDVLPAFTCVRAISNLWSICLGVNFLRLKWSKSEKPVPSIFIRNILPSKALRTLFLPSKRLHKFLRTSYFCCFLSGLNLIFSSNSKFQVINHLDLHQLLL